MDNTSLIQEASASIGAELRPTTLTFVSDRLDLPATLCARMKLNKWTWQTISTHDFFDLSDPSSCSAAFLLDAGDVHLIDWKRLEDKISDFDQRNIPVVLLHWPIAMELTRFRLAAKIRSASIEELWARIESAIHFSHALANSPSDDQHHRQIEEQLKLAGTIQRNFLPQTLPATDRIRFATAYHPAEWVSGDIYDVVRLDETHLGFYIADAVGHSIPAALLTMFLKHAAVLRKTEGNRYTLFSPKEVIDHLNTAMIQQQLKGSLFATVCCCQLNTETLDFSFARAGHPYPILIRPGQEPIQLQSRGGLLGVFEEMDFEQIDTQLYPGDKILLYSDGIEPLIGQIENNGQFIFTDTFRKLCRLPIISMVAAIEEAVAGWKRTSAEIDDITILGMEII